MWEEEKGISIKLVRVLSSMINLMIMIIALLLFAFCGYALWDSNQLYERANSEQFDVYKPVYPESDELDGLDFEDLQAVNGDVFAWLTVYGTDIDYPVVQGETDMSYINTNVFGEYAASGSIFLDSDNKRDFSDYNSIIYGHHMGRQKMFGEIGLFTEKGYFDERRYGQLFYNGTEHGLEFFAFLHVDAYDFTIYMPGVKGKEVQQVYLDRVLEKAMHTRDIGITVEDEMVMLSTCSTDNTNGRDILVGRITDEVFEDTFYEEVASWPGPGVDIRQAIYELLPWWLWLLIISTLIGLVVLIIVKRAEKKRRRMKQWEKEYNLEQFMEQYRKKEHKEDEREE